MQVIAPLAAGLLALALAASPQPGPEPGRAMWPDRSRRATVAARVQEAAPELLGGPLITNSLPGLPESLARPSAGARVDIDPERWVQSPSRTNQTYTRSFTLTNRQGPFRGMATVTKLGMAFAHQLTVMPGDIVLQRVSMPASFSSVMLRVNGAAPGSVLDLYLFHCPKHQCRLVAESIGVSSANSLTVAEPDYGSTWVLAVDGRSVPAAGMRVDYLQWHEPRWTTKFTVSDQEADHPTGDRWQVTASVNNNMTAGPGFILGFIQVKSGDETIAEAPVELGAINR